MGFTQPHPYQETRENEITLRNNVCTLLFQQMISDLSNSTNRTPSFLSLTETIPHIFVVLSCLSQGINPTCDTKHRTSSFLEWGGDRRRTPPLFWTLLAPTDRVGPYGPGPWSRGILSFLGFPLPLTSSSQDGRDQEYTELS